MIHQQMYDDYNDTLEGDMSIPSTKRNTTQPGAPDFNTLDEPIKETIVSVLVLRNQPTLAPLPLTQF